MTDLVAQLRAVEEAAEKAREEAEWFLRECQAGRRPARPSPRELAAHVVTLTDLPFGAIREELERLAWIEEAARVLVACETCRRGLFGTNEHLQALDTVLCPDPAGGEG